MADTIQIRRDTAANWASVNPVLAQGEMGLETDTEQMKLGDGTTAYNALNYFVTSQTNVGITGGTIDGTVIGGSTAAAGSFTTGQFNTSLNVDGTVTANGLTVDGASVLNDSLTVKDSASPIITLTSFPGTQDTVATIFSGRAEFSGTNSFLRFGTNNGTSTLTRLNIASNGDISFYEDTGTTPKLQWSASGETLTFSDNAKAIFGAGSDLQIYHDGSNSYISDVGTGDLRLSGNNLRMQNADNTANYIKANDGSNVELFFNNASKLATTTTGIDVTGTVTADGLTVDNSGTAISITNGDGLTQLGKLSGDAIDGFVIEGKANNNLTLRTKANSLGEGIKLQNTSGNNMMFIDGTTGDISFFEDTGTTPKFFWDASAERLGINESNPLERIHITGDDAKIRIENGAEGNEVVSLGHSDTGGGGFISLHEDDGNVGSIIRGYGDSELFGALTTGGRIRIGEELDDSFNNDALLQIGSAAGDRAFIQMIVANDQEAAILFGNVDDDVRGSIEYQNADDSMRFAVNNNNEGMRIDSSRNVGIGTSSPATKLDVDGAIRASTGILFGSDTAAANTLDDYEEGFYTCTVSGDTSGSITATGASYRKIGNMVNVNIAVINPGTVSLSGFLKFSLPFTAGGSGDYSGFDPHYTGSVLDARGLTPSGDYLSVTVRGGDSYAVIKEVYHSATTETTNYDVNLPTNTLLHISITYFTD